MKSIYFWIMSLSVINFLNGQIMYSEEELAAFREQVRITKSLGRDAIVHIAAKKLSDEPELLIRDKQVYISVWYNNISVKVEVVQHSPIRYISLGSVYYTEVSIGIVPEGVSMISGTTISNTSDQNASIHNDIKLYRSTREKEHIIDKVISLNNANGAANFIDKNIETSPVIIREQQDYYAIQLRDSYPITYKMDKKSGRIYDYEDPYRDMYPSPATRPATLYSEVEGKWIEMKEK